MIITIDIGLDYDPSEPNYQKMLKANDYEDTPEAFVEWGLLVNFWGHDLDTRVIKVHSSEQSASDTS